MKRIINFFKAIKVGFRWTYDGDGFSSHTAATLISFHHPEALIWRWAIYYVRPRRGLSVSWYLIARPYGSASFCLPLIGGLRIAWQPKMMRAAN